jgi:ribonuclease HI
VERTEKSTMGLAKTTSQMVSIQRAGALAITGGLRMLLIDMLNVYMHLLPVSMLVNKWCHGALMRMAALPEEYLLYKIMKSRRLSKTKRHKGPLHHLTKWFKIDINAMEKTPTVVRNPSKAGELPFELSIAKSREDSIKEMEEALEEIQIFTDGSAMEGKVGAAAILIRAGRHTWTLRLHLGLEAEHIVYEAELVGIVLGLHILSTKKKNGKLALIGLDNQAVIKAFDSELRNLGHHLTWEALCMAEHLKKKRWKSKAGLTICWTAGHKGLVGNELADKEAKEAVKGHTLETELSPLYLRKMLLINPSAI